MAKLKIVKIGHPVLRHLARKLGLEEIKAKRFGVFLKDMVRTMHTANGVGLAANQVGHGIRAIVLECQGNKRYPEGEYFSLEMYVNARILKYAKDLEVDWEGCLSIPGYRGLVPRAKQVTFEAWLPDGQKIEKTVSGFHARVIQHEIDHIDGRVYLDRMPDLKTLMHLDEFNREFHMRAKDHSS